MSKKVKINIDKVKKSYENVIFIDSYISRQNFHECFFEIEDYIDKINIKHDKCFSKYQDSIYEITESIDKIKNKINLLTDSLRKTLETTQEIILSSEEESSKIKKRNNLAPTNNDKDKVIEKQDVELPNEHKVERDYPKNYNTTPIGLGIAAAGITGSVGAVVIDSMIPNSARRKKIDSSKSEENSDEYEEYEIMEEIEENKKDGLKIHPSLTPYQALRNQENMKKYYSEEEE